MNGGKLMDVEVKTEVSTASTGPSLGSVTSCGEATHSQQCEDLPSVSEAIGINIEPRMSRQISPGVLAGLMKPGAEACQAAEEESKKHVSSKEAPKDCKMQAKTGSHSHSEKVAKAKEEEEQHAREEAAAKKRQKKIQQQFHQAVKDGNFTKVRLLMRDRADVNVKLPDIGRTPIHDACMEQHQKIVKYLLNEKANINIVSDNKGYSPLHVCVSKARKGHGDALETLQRFLDARADANIVNRAGRTPLQMAKDEDVPELVAALA